MSIIIRTLVKSCLKARSNREQKTANDNANRATSPIKTVVTLEWTNRRKLNHQRFWAVTFYKFVCVTVSVDTCTSGGTGMGSSLDLCIIIWPLPIRRVLFKPLLDLRVHQPSILWLALINNDDDCRFKFIIRFSSIGRRKFWYRFVFFGGGFCPLTFKKTSRFVEVFFIVAAFLSYRIKSAKSVRWCNRYGEPVFSEQLLLQRSHFDISSADWIISAVICRWILFFVINVTQFSRYICSVRVESRMFVFLLLWRIGARNV